MRSCPYCSEAIQNEAAKCRHCGEWLDPARRPPWSVDYALLGEMVARKLVESGHQETVRIEAPIDAPPTLGSPMPHSHLSDDEGTTSDEAPPAGVAPLWAPPAWLRSPGPTPASPPAQVVTQPQAAAPPVPAFEVPDVSRTGAMPAVRLEGTPAASASPITLEGVPAYSPPSPRSEPDRPVAVPKQPAEEVPTERRRSRGLSHSFESSFMDDQDDLEASSGDVSSSDVSHHPASSFGGAVSRGSSRSAAMTYALAAGGVAIVLGLFFRDELFGRDPLPEARALETVAASPVEPKAPAPIPEPVTKTEPAPTAPPVPVPVPAPAPEQPETPAPAPPAADPTLVAEKLQAAKASYKRRKLTDCRAALDEVLSLVPRHPEALVLLAQVQLEQGQVGDALVTAGTCVEVDAGRADCWLTIAVLEQDKKNLPRALEAWERYLQLAPDGNYARNAVQEIKRLKAKLG